MQHLPHEPLVRSVAARKLVQIIKASIFAAQKFHYPTGYPVSQKARRLASVAWAFFRTLSNQVVVVVVVHALDLDCSLGHVAPTSYTLGAPTTTLDSIFFPRARHHHLPIVQLSLAKRAPRPERCLQCPVSVGRHPWAWQDADRQRPAVPDFLELNCATTHRPLKVFRPRGSCGTVRTTTDDDDDDDRLSLSLHGSRD